MIKYQIKEGDKNQDAGDKIIVKTGGEIEFSLRNIDNDIIYLEKTKTELIAQKGIENATIANIEKSHPHISKMTQEDLTAAYLFRHATGTLTAADEKLEEIERQLKEYAEEKEEIKKQTGLEIKKQEDEKK